MIIGGLWLLFQGKWSIVIIGIIYSVFGASLLFYFMLPGYGLSSLSFKLMEKKHNIIAFPLSFLAWFYNVLLITISSVLIYSLLLNMTNRGALFPTILWAFTLSTAPWAYMASRENNTDGYNATYMTVLIQNIGLGITSLMLLFKMSLPISLIPFYISMLVLLVTQSVVTFKMSAEVSGKKKKHVA